MSASKIDVAGKVTILDGRAEPDEVITEADVKDAPKLARVIGRMLATLATLRRAWAPRRIDFEDIPVGSIGATVQPLEHGFKGRVRWWVVGWQNSSGAGPSLRETTAAAGSTDTTLVLQSYIAGTATIRVEEAG